MSVVLTACRHSKQRAIDRALKRKAEKQKQRRNRAEQQFMCDTQVALEDLSLTRMWSFQMLGTVYTVVLLLESGRDTVDLYCNDEELEYDTHVQDGVIQFDFLISGSHKARIRCCPQMGSLQHTLIVAGEEVPECE